MSYIIRFAEIEDAAALARIHDLSWQAAYRDIIDEETIKRQGEKRLAMWEQMLQEDKHIIFLSELKEEIIGFSIMLPSRDHDQEEGVMELQAFYFSPQYWQLGYAEHLIKHLVSWVKKRKYKALYAWVLQANERAIRFYQKHGFYFDETKKNILIGGKEYTEVRYWNMVRRNDNTWWRLI